MRRRPIAGLLLSLVVTATAGASGANRLGTVDGDGSPAAAVSGPGAGSDPIPGALPPPPGKTLLVSRKKSGPGAPFPNAGSIEPSASADGNLVAFTSIASDLVRGDEVRTIDVFVLDRRTNTVRRAPRPPAPGGAIGQSSDPSISADGRIVAFTWLAPTPPATPAPTPTPTEPVILFDPVPATYVWAWDLRTNRIEPVSRSARARPQPGASHPSVSANGRFIAFETVLDFPGDLDHSVSDVLRYDRQRKETVLVTLDPNGRPHGGASYSPSISGDGNKIAYVSDGGDSVVHEDTGEGEQVYVRDMAAKVTTEVSQAFDGGRPSGRAMDPVISGDGRFVAFTSNSTNLVDGVTPRFPMVYRRNLAAGRTELVSVTQAGGVSEGAAGAPSISTDGGMVAFTSTAADLAPAVGALGPGAAVEPAAINLRVPAEVYLRDMTAKETVLISVSLDRAPARAHSGEPSVAGQGRFTFFSSDSDRLFAKDGNDALDVFVRDLPPMPVLNPGQLDLGAAPKDVDSAPLAATLGNIGWSPLAVLRTPISGPNAAQFRIASNGCAPPRTLKRNEVCTMTLVFKGGGNGTRTATLSVADNLVTSNLTVALRGRTTTVPRPKLEVDPEVGRPGTVVIVEGTGFPNSSQVKLRWSRGITPHIDPIKPVGGAFRVPVLVFHNDLIGPRNLIAEPVRPGDFPAVSVPVLVTVPPTIPPQFSQLRFIDLPLVLVIRG